MPPRKTIAKLQELAFSATSKLVHVSCKKVEDEFPTPVDMDADTSGCKRAVQEMQNHLLRYIRPDDWEPMFQAVMELQQQDRILDQRIIYCTFINENINLRKMKFGYKHENFDLATVLKRPLVDFWLLQHLPLFTQLVEADFTDALCDNIPVMCKALVNLETVILPKNLPSEAVESVITSCRKIRKLTGGLKDVSLQRLAFEALEHLESIDWRISGNIINTLDRDRKLKIRKLKVYINSVENMRVMLEMCPLVEDLYIRLRGNDNIKTEMLQVLATSTLKIKKLNLWFWDITPAVIQLCFSKGSYLTSLQITLATGVNPLLAIQSIAELCPNLTHFQLAFSCVEALDQDLISTHEISFPKLECLSIVDFIPGEGGAVVVLNCIRNAPELATFSLYLGSMFDVNDDNARLCNLVVPLFSNASVMSLRNVNFWCENELISLLVIQTICDNCKEMASLKISKLSEEAEDYLKEFWREAKARNLNFYYDFLSVTMLQIFQTFL